MLISRISIIDIKNHIIYINNARPPNIKLLISTIHTVDISNAHTDISNYIIDINNALLISIINNVINDISIKIIDINNTYYWYQ